MSEKDIPQIQLTPVKSSNISSVGFDTASKTLAISFKGSGVYYYQDVNPSTYSEMMASKSVGKFFHANIKGQFKSVKR